MSDFDSMGIFIAVAFYGFMFWFLRWVDSPAKKRNRSPHTEETPAPGDWTPTRPGLDPEVIRQILRPTPWVNRRRLETQLDRLREGREIGQDGQGQQERHSEEGDDLCWVFEDGEQRRAR